MFEWKAERRQEVPLLCWRIVIRSCLCYMEWQDGSAHGHNAQLAPSDLAEVSAGAGVLFQRTADMSDEAVVTLLGALHLVSAASLPTAALQAGPTKYVPLNH